VKGKKTGGRVAGTPNVRPTIRAAFEDVFALLQADKKSPSTLMNWAVANPTEYYRLSAKLIPAKIEADLHVTLESLVAGSLGKAD
jgi:hypothetical protein